jgi:hypothetical protein
MSRTTRSTKLAAGAAALALAAFTTACSDSPTGPAAPAAASAARLHADTGAIPPAARPAPRAPGDGTLFYSHGSVRVVDGNGAAVKGAQVFFQQWANGKVISSLAVTDGSSADLDADIGEVRARLPMSGGVVRAGVSHSIAPWSGRGVAVDKTLQMFETDFGTLKLMKMPELIIDFRANGTNAVVNGGTITVRLPNDGTLLRYAADNAIADFDPTPGRLKTYYDTDHQVLVTETAVQANTQLADNSPFVTAIAYANSKAFTLLHTVLK